MATTSTGQFQSDEAPSSLLSATTLVGPATVFVAAGLLVPLAILFRYSFNHLDPRRVMVETFSLDNYVKFFADPYYTGVLWTTLRVAALCTVTCLVMGLPLAYVLARTQSRFKNVLIMLVVLPLFVGNAVRAAGWMTLFGSKGFLNVTLMQLGIITAPLQMMFTEGAVVAGIIAVNLPYMVLTLQSVIEGINRNVEEAAFSLGAGPARWPQVQDDGALGLRTVSAQQLAVRRRRRFRADDRDAGADGDGKYPGTAPVPAMTIERCSR